jgi:hypothetical protein
MLSATQKGYGKKERKNNAFKKKKKKKKKKARLKKKTQKKIDLAKSYGALPIRGHEQRPKNSGKNAGKPDT